MRWSFTFDARERSEVLREFVTGARLSGLVGDHELMRYWSIIRGEGGVAYLRHRGRGAVMVLELEGERVSDVRLVEGDEARRLIVEWGFRPSAATRAAVGARLVAGASVAAFEAERIRLVLDALPSPEGLRLWAVGDEGVVEVRVSGEVVVSHRWLVGGEALGALEAAAESRRWAQPKVGPMAVVDISQARIYVGVAGGDPLAERQFEGHFEILAATSMGQRRFVFEVVAGCGVGLSACLDAAMLISFSRRVERELPATFVIMGNKVKWARDLRLAAEGLRIVLGLMPLGAEVVAEGGERSAASKALRAKSPECFQRAWLVAQAEGLEAMASELARDEG
jgi:hypothetical protein